jgi:hypothetical protein
MLIALFGSSLIAWEPTDSNRQVASEQACT